MSCLRLPTSSSALLLLRLFLKDLQLSSPLLPCSTTDTSGLASAVTLLEITLAEQQMRAMHGAEYRSSALDALRSLKRVPHSRAKARLSCAEASASVIVLRWPDCVCLFGVAA